MRVGIRVGEWSGGSGGGRVEAGMGLRIGPGSQNRASQFVPHTVVTSLILMPSARTTLISTRWSIFLSNPTLRLQFKCSNQSQNLSFWLNA